MLGLKHLSNVPDLKQITYILTLSFIVSFQKDTSKNIYKYN